MITILFYDFEVFKYDWLVVIIDSETKETHVIINDKEELEQFYKIHKGDFWIGYNSRDYDQWILKVYYPVLILKEINDFIIVQKKKVGNFTTVTQN